MSKSRAKATNEDLELCRQLHQNTNAVWGYLRIEFERPKEFAKLAKKLKVPSLEQALPVLNAQIKALNERLPWIDLDLIEGTSALNIPIAESNLAKLEGARKRLAANLASSLTPSPKQRQELPTANGWKCSGLPSRLENLANALSQQSKKISTADLKNIIRQEPSRIISDHIKGKWKSWILTWIGRERGFWWLKPPSNKSSVPRR